MLLLNFRYFNDVDQVLIVDPLQEFEVVEICAKVIFQVELSRDISLDDRDLFGVSVEAELADDSEAEDELCVFISDVLKNGCAYRVGKSK